MRNPDSTASQKRIHRLPRTWTQLLSEHNLSTALTPLAIPQGSNASSLTWRCGVYVVSRSGDPCREGSWVFMRHRLLVPMETGRDHGNREGGDRETSGGGNLERHASGGNKGSEEPERQVPQEDEGNNSPNLECVCVGRIAAIAVPDTDHSGLNLSNVSIVCEKYNISDVNDGRFDMPLLTPDAESTHLIISPQVKSSLLNGSGNYQPWLTFRNLSRM